MIDCLQRSLSGRLFGHKESAARFNFAIVIAAFAALSGGPFAFGVFGAMSEEGALAVANLLLSTGALKYEFAHRRRVVRQHFDRDNCFQVAL